MLETRALLQTHFILEEAPPPVDSNPSMSLKVAVFKGSQAAVFDRLKMVLNSNARAVFRR